MSQKLIIPFKRAMMLCGYKNANYKDAWGYPHYGVDISSKQGNAGTDDSIYGSGVGEVVAAGEDNSLGYGVAVLYKDCESRDSTETADLIVRYMHMVSIAVAKGDSVTTDTILGVEGKEGTEDYHLHMELDTDTKYPVYTPQVSKGHTFWKKGTDSTLNPSLWMWQDKSHVLVAPTYNPAWLNTEDKNIPVIAEESDEQIPIAYDEEAEENYYGDPIWYVYDKELEVYYFFDKWWRKVGTDTSPGSGRYASDEEKKKAKAWSSSIPEKYFKANDPDGKAGISVSAETADTDSEIATLRAAVTAYEVERATIFNRLKEIITLLEN